MVKKLAIVTFRFLNFGTVLQSLGLQEALHKMGINDVEILDFENEAGPSGKDAFVETLKEQIRLYGLIKGTYRSIKEVLFVLQTKQIAKKDHTQLKRQREESYKKFIDKNLKLSKPLTCKDLRDPNFVKLLPYDCYLAGSDQIWNEKYTKCLDIFFLAVFPRERKRLSYAGSFGKNCLTDDRVNKYKDLIKNVDCVLVRETAAKYISEEQLGVNAHLVLDPTLLQKSSFWEGFAEKPNNEIPNEYILVYSLNHSKKIYKEAIRIAKEKNLAVVVIKRSFCPPQSNKFIELYGIGPQHFLWLVKNSKMVITNSFHALVFSLVFNRPCYPYLDAAEEVNERLISLLNIVGHSHVISYEHEGHLNIFDKKFDYDKINHVIEMEREKSFSLLQKALEE